MKKFFKDFISYQKAGLVFCKENWFMLLVVGLLSFIVECMYYGIRYGIWFCNWLEAIWNKLTGVFTKA